MDSKEHVQAGNALVQWFNSQEIGPADAEAIMSKVLAKLLVRNIKTREDAHRVLDTFTVRLANAMNDQMFANRYRGGK